MLTGTNLDFVRAYNRRVTMEIIRSKGVVSRSDVAKRTGLTLQAVSTIFSYLVEDGWIVEVGKRAIARGQPPTEYSLNPSTAVSIGVTVELDAIKAVSVDLSGRILQRIRVGAFKPPPDKAIRVIKDAVLKLVENPLLKDRAVLGIGISIPGTPNATTGFVTTLPHIPGWENFPLREKLVFALPYPIHVANDAIVAGLGESWFGPSERSKNAFYVLFAHGLNGAMLSEQHLYGGIWGVTGKFGHIPVVPNGKPCRGCGGRGCVECYASFLSLLKALDLENISSEGLQALSAVSDRRLDAWIQQAARHLTTALLSVENLFDPDVIIFGGRLPEGLLRQLIERIEQDISPRRMKIKSKHPKYALATFSDDASLIGAATLPMYLELSPDINLVFEQARRE